MNVSAAEVFCTLHESPLMLAQVELHLKRLQLRYRPQDYPLFINLDSHAFAVLGCQGPDFQEPDFQGQGLQDKDSQGAGNKLLEMLAGHDDLVVEVIENTRP